MQAPLSGLFGGRLLLYRTETGKHQIAHLLRLCIELACTRCVTLRRDSLFHPISALGHTATHGRLFFQCPQRTPQRVFDSQCLLCCQRLGGYTHDRRGSGISSARRP